MHDVVSGLRLRNGKPTEQFVEQRVAQNALSWVTNNSVNTKADKALLKLGKDPINQTAAAGLSAYDFSDVKGHVVPRRALEVAAAGSHNVLMMGPPGTGKSMLASCLSSVLPPMTEQEALEAASVASVSHGDYEAISYGERPFRSPHHSSSSTALIGGGYRAVPGEISLAHNGVLFLDEMAEFPRRALDALREPLETGVVHVSRLAHRATYPSKFQLIGATNPCPCGYLGDVSNRCECTESQLQKYRGRLSGPLLDRIDLQIVVGREETESLFQSDMAESSFDIRERVADCRSIQFERQGCANQHIGAPNLLELCSIDRDAVDFLATATKQLKLSHRAVHRSLRVARTIADLSNSPSVLSMHIGEALSYRLPSS